jgi:cytochrome c oxidase subunit 2
MGKDALTRLKNFRFFSAMVLFTLVWLTVRFPFQFSAAVGDVLGTENRLDPATLHLRGEFVESNLGPALESDGSFTVRMIAQQYVFVPQCVVIPAGVPVRFRITSADAAHELTVSGTDYKIKVVPGVASEARFEFERTGEYPMPCHEFCGPGHYAMRAALVVVPQDQFRALSPDERMTCESR